MNSTVTPIIGAFLSRNNNKLNEKERGKKKRVCMKCIIIYTYGPTHPTLGVMFPFCRHVKAMRGRCVLEIHLSCSVFSESVIEGEREMKMI
jgi:hypothetical protein